MGRVSGPAEQHLWCVNDSVAIVFLLVISGTANLQFGTTAVVEKIY